MTHGLSIPTGTALRHVAAAAALLALSAGANAALMPFTLDPTAAALAGPAFTADNLLISDYSTVTNSGSSFTETGFLSITGAQLAGVNLAPAGLNTTYGLYISFTGTGTTTFGSNPLTSVTAGSFSTLSYTLWGYNGGGATFGFSGTTPTTSALGSVALASGTLVNGSVVSIPSGNSFSPSASATLTVNPLVAAFFASPSPFSSQALTSFTNTSSQVQTFAGGFMIQQGGGSVNFVSTVPEPASYAMLMTGVAAIGFVVRRRRPGASR